MRGGRGCGGGRIVRSVPFVAGNVGLSQTNPPVQGSLRPCVWVRRWRRARAPPLRPAFPTVMGPPKYAPPPPPLPRRELMDDGPDIAILYGTEATVVLDRRFVSAPAERAEGELANISRARLDLDALMAMDTKGLLTGILDVIRSREAFTANLTDEGRKVLDSSVPLRRGTSRHMLRHWGNLLQWGVMSRSKVQKVVLPAFTVPKKVHGLRLVCDGRKLNRLMRAPPPMLLPSIHQVVRRFMDNAYVVQADGRSWFYQFPLADGVDDFFGVNLSGARGPFVRAKLNVLCMGWSWAPCIAHRSAMVLLPEDDGLAWVDNFFVVGKTLPEAEKRYSSFLRRAERVGAELNDDEGEGVPRANFCALGLEFDLASSPRRYRAAPDWIEKCVDSPVLNEVLKNSCTARDFYKVLGGFVWFLYCTKRRLCYFRVSLSFLRRTASVLAIDPQKWDVKLEIPPSVISEFAGIVSVMRSNDWIEDQPERPTVVAWSDASDREWAALIESEVFEPVTQGVFSNPEQHHIYLKELYAAWRAVRLAAAENTDHEVSLQVDNAAAVAAINKGHSKNFLANELLCAIFDTAKATNMSVSASWVDTLSQRADEFTRGTVAPSLASLPPVLTEYERVEAMFC